MKPVISVTTPDLMQLNFFTRSLSNKQFMLATKRGLKRSVSPIVRKVKAKTPVGPTGNLRRSIGVKDIRGSKLKVYGIDPRVAMFIGAKMKKRKGNKTSVKSNVSGHHAHLVAYGHKASGKFKYARDPQGIGSWIQDVCNANADFATTKFQAFMTSKVMREFNKINTSPIRKIRL